MLEPSLAIPKTLKLELLLMHCRIETEDPNAAASTIDIKLPSLIKPYSEVDDPTLAKPRKLNDDPNV
jgi:hypothetical protein